MSESIDVLVASADDGLRGQVTLALDGERFDVGGVETTDTAVHQIAASPPDVLLVDLELEGSGALALARTLRAQPETEAVRVLVLVPTGGSVPEDAPGVDGTLAVPFTSLALLRRVQDVLGE